MITNNHSLLIFYSQSLIENPSLPVELRHRLITYSEKHDIVVDKCCYSDLTLPLQMHDFLSTVIHKSSICELSICVLHCRLALTWLCGSVQAIQMLCGKPCCVDMCNWIYMDCGHLWHKQL